MILLLTRAWDYVREVTLRDFWWAEFGSAVALISWAVFAITSPDRLSSRHFGPLLYFSSEQNLEYLTYCVGVFQLGAVVMHKPHPRMVGALGASFLTGSIFLAILQAQAHPQPGVGYYGVAWGTNLLASVKLIRRRDSI